ncbi:acetate--CoA ligase family protein [Neobacillus niacini]|uniref:acetate--CoA ligase family protein n=1 Tax=Neobacillus niacini TaxID=86668 RepID=UPI0027D8BB4D|nr:acetate--CoA ligase family protein [Neobacillus niacini]
MQTVGSIIKNVKNENRKTLTEIESKEILNEIGIATPRFELATTADEAVLFADKLGYPVVLKIVSPEITHKSDANGVMLNLLSANEVKNAFSKIINNAFKYDESARVLGVSVQTMIKKGTEVIIGMKRDENFGPVLLFGLGGIFVELLKDVSLKVLPLDDVDIDKMFAEIKGGKILNGYRNSKPADLEELKQIIKKVAQLSSEYPEIFELELNPVLVQEKDKGAIALDARIILQ